VQEIEVTFNIEVKEDFVDMLVNWSDWLGTGYCGYWAFGVVQDPSIGWLFADCDEDGYCSDELKAQFAEAERIWRKEHGEPHDGPCETLPKRFHSMDKNNVLEVIRQGVKRYGPDFQEQYDSESLDVAVQMTFLHEVVYG
jgi:hypothetical protein